MKKTEKIQKKIKHLNFMCIEQIELADATKAIAPALIQRSTDLKSQKRKMQHYTKGRSYKAFFN
ncbi:hypothetical protein GNY06_03415 [Elizabethkingia argentiflava]|uniref:Uncharacterized protein n=1 Tax=Elizabethkingia argenteiflava TaxID=2681556 RepID=A0A845PRJ8_9FLAO|nr:hypothetical protein [Elizabethkingia argenteiflava]NAW50474.1 hypothetical protein [Elizabethkingia argenteiflava]